jgi:hypothetical protein
VDTPRVPIGRSGRSVGRAPSGHDPLGNFRVVIRRRMGQNTRGCLFFILYKYKYNHMIRRAIRSDSRRAVDNRRRAMTTTTTTATAGPRCDETSPLLSVERERGRKQRATEWTSMLGFVSVVVASALVCANTLHPLREEGFLAVKCEPGPGVLCADDGATCAGPSAACYNAGGIPKTFWMIWDSGWDAAPASAKRSRDSWTAYNPDWTMRALDLQTALELTDVLNPASQYYIHEDRFRQLRIEHKCDALRVVLLVKYGGLWVDASLQANRPLKDWFGLQRQSQLFIRSDNGAFARPHFSVWFMASAPGSYVFQRIAHKFIADINAGVMAGAGGSGIKYVHLGAGVMHQLWIEDQIFRAKVGPVHDANVVHCFNVVCRDAYAFKRCGRALTGEPFDMQAETTWKETTTTTCLDDSVAGANSSATTAA